jgi:hypothetical protein
MGCKKELDWYIDLRPQLQTPPPLKKKTLPQILFSFEDAGQKISVV